MSFSLDALLALARSTWGEGEIVVAEMPGGASLRRFFRVTAASGASAVGMFFPDALASEEASSDGPRRQRWPFLEVQALLRERAVEVPAVLGEDCPAGWLLMEDLGDVTLAEALLREPEQKRSRYQRVVQDLARAHHALRELPASSVVASRSFDVELLRWEIEHFLEWGLVGRGTAVSEQQAARFRELANAIAIKVRELPYGFSHRDFQSRNLMCVPTATSSERLVWLDFQDALQGPRVYDLVALLNDSYQSFSEEFVRDRLREYCDVRGIPQHYEAICREFDWVTVQRKLKDAGRFVFIEHKKGDASYLKFVDPTIALVRQALQRLSAEPSAQQLSTLLDELLP